MSEYKDIILLSYDTLKYHDNTSYNNSFNFKIKKTSKLPEFKQIYGFNKQDEKKMFMTEEFQKYRKLAYINLYSYIYLSTSEIDEIYDIKYINTPYNIIKKTGNL